MVVVLDIGLPKTGTTSRQWYYSRHPGINLIHPFNLKFELVKHQVNVISDETIVNDSSHCMCQDALKRLHILFPDAKVILMTRDVDDWLDSMYQQYITGLAKGSMHRYEWYDFIKNHDTVVMDGICCVVKKIFDDVLFLDFDDFKTDNKLVMKRICEFIDVDFIERDLPIFKKRKSTTQIRFLRWYNSSSFPGKEEMRKVVRLV